MFNLFNKKPQEPLEPEIPDWVQNTCMLLSISDSLYCKNWGIVQVFFAISLLKDANRTFDSSYLINGECCNLLYQLISTETLNQWDNNSSIAENANLMYNNSLHYKARFLEIVEFVNAWSKTN